MGAAPAGFRPPSALTCPLLAPRLQAQRQRLCLSACTHCPRTPRDVPPVRGFAFSSEAGPIYDRTCPPVWGILTCTAQGVRSFMSCAPARLPHSRLPTPPPRAHLQLQPLPSAASPSSELPSTRLSPPLDPLASPVTFPCLSVWLLSPSLHQGWRERLTLQSLSHSFAFWSFSWKPSSPWLSLLLSATNWSHTAQLPRTATAVSAAPLSS